MFPEIKGFAQFISVERGLMLFMISIGATFLMAKTLAWTSAIYLGFTVFCIWAAVDAMNNLCDVDLDVISDPDRACKFFAERRTDNFFKAVVKSHRGPAESGS